MDYIQEPTQVCLNTNRQWISNLYIKVSQGELQKWSLLAGGLCSERKKLPIRFSLDKLKLVLVDSKQFFFQLFLSLIFIVYQSVFLVFCKPLQGKFYSSEQKGNILFQLLYSPERKIFGFKQKLRGQASMPLLDTKPYRFVNITMCFPSKTYSTNIFRASTTFSHHHY